MSKMFAGPSRREIDERPPVRAQEEIDMVALFAGLGLDDIAEIDRHNKGKGRLDALQSDADLALALFTEEARAFRVRDSDRALAQSLQEEEERARPQLPTNPAPPTRTAVPARPVLERPPAQQARRIVIEEQAVAQQRPASWFGSTFAAFGSFLGLLASPNSSNTPQGTASTPRSTLTRSRPTGKTCVACQDPILGSAIRAPCGHDYDKECILSLFTASLKDESLFPPRCCRQNVPLAAVRVYMGAGPVAAFNEKTREFGTQKRVYCARSACSAFLGAQSAAPGFFSSPVVFDCARAGCGTRTCSHCKAILKPGSTHRCVADADDSVVLALSTREGWKRCPGCAAMVELNLGCYHITCRCRAQFCYLCCAEWKTCRCPQWDERRLLVAAEERVQRQHGAAPAVARRVVGVPAPQPVLRRDAAPPIPPRPARPVFPARQPAAAARQAPPPDQPAEALHAPRTWATLAHNRAEEHVGRQPGMDLQLPTNVVNLRSVNIEAAGQRNPGPSVQQHGITTRIASPSTQARLTRAGLRTAAVAPPTNAGQRLQGPPLRSRDQLIREAMEDLRVNHECEHTSWKYRRGGGDCQHCWHYLPSYLFRCTGCETLACNRCRRNRL